MNREIRASILRYDGSILASGWGRVDFTTDPLHFDMTLTPMEYRQGITYKLQLDTFPTNEELKELRTQIRALTMRNIILEEKAKNV